MFETMPLLYHVCEKKKENEHILSLICSIKTPGLVSNRYQAGSDCQRTPVPKDKQQLQESKPRRVSPPAGGEIKQKYAKIQDMRLDFCSLIGQVCAFGVRTARCKFPLDPRPAWIESVSKRLF